MRLHPFPSERVSVGIDITSDAVRLVALNLDPGHQDDQAAVIELDLLSTWNCPCDWQSKDVGQWVTRLCETLESRLPENTCPRRTRVSLCVPTPWLKFQFQHTQANGRAFDLQRRPTVSVDEDSLFRIASVLARRGYRLDWVVPDGVAVGLALPNAMGFASPCVVMLHRDGGTITLFDNDKAVLVRSLPSVAGVKGEPQRCASPARWQQWRDRIAEEINATLEYYGRLADDSKFADRITQESPILFGGSVFEMLPEHGLSTVELLSQWSAALGRPVALWTSQVDSAHATATSLAMLPNVGVKSSPTIRRTLASANLLPAAFELGQRYAKVRARWAAGLIIALIITVMFGVDGYIVQSNRHASQQHHQDVIEPIRGLMRHLQNVESECVRKLEQMRALASQRPKDEALQALAAVAAAIPDGEVDLHRTELDFIKGRWVFSGVAQSRLALDEMHKRLRQSHWVADPTPDDSVQSVIITTVDRSGDAPTETRNLGGAGDRRVESKLIYETDGRFQWSAHLSVGDWSTSQGSNDE